MESQSKIILLFLCITLVQFALVSSNPQPVNGHNVQAAQQTHEENEANSAQKQTPESGLAHYSYRSPASNGGSPGYNSYSGYARDAYSAPTQQGSPWFGINSNADFQLSAYVGQIFWGFVIVTVSIALIIWIIRVFGVGLDVGGLVQKIKDSGSASGKSLDLDKLTTIVYNAFDKYGNWAAKNGRQLGNIGKSN